MNFFFYHVVTELTSLVSLLLLNWHPKIFILFWILLTLTKGSYSIKMLTTSCLNMVPNFDSSTSEERRLAWTPQKSERLKLIIADMHVWARLNPILRLLR